MNMKVFARLTALVSTALLSSGPLAAHVVDLGAFEPDNSLNDLSTPSNVEHDVPRLDATSSTAFVDVATPAANHVFDVTAAGIRFNGTLLLPWVEGSIYSFSDLVPRIHGSLGLKGRVRTFYRDVITIAAAPKAETWLATLIVLGLVAVQLRRTQRLLAHHPLA